VNLRRRKSKTAAAGVRRVGRIQHLGSVVCFPQGVRASPSERIRVGKLRRYRTFEISLKESTGICAVECSSKSCKCRCWRASSEKEYLAILKKSSRRRNRRPRSCGEGRKIPSVVGFSETVARLQLHPEGRVQKIVIRWINSRFSRQPLD
jgi:hypothetical protein